MKTKQMKAEINYSKICYECGKEIKSNSYKVDNTFKVWDKECFDKISIKNGWWK